MFDSCRVQQRNLVLWAASLVVAGFEKENRVAALGKASCEWGSTRAGSDNYIVVVLKNDLI
jgi:hypothetical protein